MKHVTAIVLLSTVALGFAACGGHDKRKLDATANQAGLAGDVLPSGAGASVDLPSLLDPQRQIRRRVGRIRWEKMTPGERLDRTFEAFYARYPPATRVLRRDRIQDRLIAASSQNCTAFKNFLLANPEVGEGFIAGMANVARSATRIIAGPGVGLALRGVRGVFARDSGFNMALFSSLTMQVITEGIDIRRQAALKKLRAARRNTSIDAYTVEAAIRDALYYHRQCSVFTGMLEARDTILAKQR